MKLLDDWRAIAGKSWAFRISGASAVLSALATGIVAGATVFGSLQGTAPHITVGVLVTVTFAATAIARLIDQSSS